ncbi:MAG: response regulator, partial [Persicimonas sp.]
VTGILRSHGHEFLVAEDGLQGWEMLHEYPVDMVVTDVQMPRMDGLEMLQRIRASEAFADLPVVILTTLGDPEDKERAMDLGADGYLVKLNFQESDLVEMVRRYISEP